MLEKLNAYDRELFVYLNSLGIEQYDGFWLIITNILTWIPLYAFLLFLVLKKYPKKEALAIIATVVAALLFVLAFTEGVKEFVARLRPNNHEELKSLIRILKTPTNYSFFSGHASTSFSITVLVVLFLRKKLKYIYLLFLWPILFSLSRIYVGVHYPSDIVVGALVGTLIAIAFYKLYLAKIAPKII